MMPREKLVRKGADSLTNVELIAIILSTGSQKNNVLKVAQKVDRYITETQQVKDKITIEELMKIDGIGLKKALSILAVFELGIRFNNIQQEPILNAKSVIPYIQYLSKFKQEHVVGIFLNARYEVLKRKEIHIGKIDSTPISTYEIARLGLQYNAVSIILSHNHPSGDPTPSHEDIQATQNLIKALSVLDISLLDHIVIAQNGWISIKERFGRLWRREENSP